MSAYIELPDEVADLFKYSDSEGLLDPEDLEEAGFRYLIGADKWIKNDVELKYDEELREISSYRKLLE